VVNGFPTILAFSFLEIAVDALVFEFMGLAMIGLCVIVLAVPCRRPSTRRLSDS
jgi:hypothetical protein